MTETARRKAAEWAGGVTSCDAVPFRVTPHNVAAEQALLRARRRRRALTSPLQRADLPRLLHVLKTKRPATSVRRGSTSHFVSPVASVSRSVSQTEHPQPRDSRTKLPDTALARLRARSKFLAHEELGDDHIRVD